MTKLLFRLCLILNLFIVNIAFAAAKPAYSSYWSNINTIISFGDSLSDIGNVNGSTNSFQRCFEDTAAPDTDWCDSTSNPHCKKLWLNYFGEQLNIPVAASTLGGHDFAYIGAPVVPVADAAPSIEYQIKYFLQNYASPSNPSQTLYTYWGGANDIRILFQPYFKHQVPNPPTPSQIEQLLLADMNYFQVQITNLALSGGQNFLVFGFPDLSQTPLIRESIHDPNLVQQIKALSQAYNQLLVQRLQYMARSLNLNIYYVDVYSFMGDVFKRPAYYNIQYLTRYCGLHSDDSSKYLFWNMIHPSSEAHYQLAQNILECGSPASFCKKL